MIVNSEAVETIAEEKCKYVRFINVLFKFPQEKKCRKHLIKEKL